jgi:glycosyltransferase involved in cell wall biosynthesis
VTTPLAFSAIVPNFNDEAAIARALSSLEAQTSAFDEILVIDDGSTDRSLDVVNQLLPTCPHVRLLENGRNLGVTATLNRGLREARGDFVVLCSANDTYHPRLVEWCRAALAAHPSVDAVTGNAAVWDDGAGTPRAGCLLPLPQRLARFSPDELVAACRRVPSVLAPGFALRRAAALAAGALSADLRWHADWFLFHVLAFTSGCVFVPEPFATIHVGGPPRFSRGMSDWTQERETIRAMVSRLSAEPALAERFRRAGLLPCYDLRELWLLRGRDARFMITPLTSWRMLVHSLAYWLKSFVPRQILMRCRAWIRI